MSINEDCWRFEDMMVPFVDVGGDGGWGICSRLRSDSLISGHSYCPRTCFVFCILEAWCFAVQSLPSLFVDQFIYD